MEPPSGDRGLSANRSEEPNAILPSLLITHPEPTRVRQTGRVEGYRQTSPLIARNWFNCCPPPHAGTQRLQWSESAVLIDPASAKEATLHHALAKQKKGGCQSNKKLNPSNFNPGRLSSWRGCLIRILSHLSYLSAKSSDCPDSKRTNALRKANNLY